MNQTTMEWVPQQIDVESFKGIKLFRWRNQNRPLVILHGPNGAGKTSVIQAIQSALGGDRLLPVKVIRDDDTSAVVRIELDNGQGEKLIIERQVALARDGGTSKLFTLRRVTDDMDLKLKAPQSVLDELIDRLTLDPTLLYREKDAKKRLDMVQRCANLPPDTLDALDDAIEAAKNGLKKAGADEEMLLNKIRTIHQLNPDGFPDTEKLRADAAAKAARCEELERQCEAWRQYRAATDDFAKRRSSLTNHRAYLERQIAELQAQLADCAAKIEDVGQEASSLQVPDGEEIASDELRNARHVATVAANVLAAADAASGHAQALQQASAKLKDAATAINTAKERLAKARDARRLAISDALNRAGLAQVVDLDDENRLIINGRPWEDVSGKERILASAKVAIATNPSIRILLLDEADSLGPEALDVLREWAEMNRFLIVAAGVWITSEGAETIEIHEGEASYTQTT